MGYNLEPILWIAHPIAIPAPAREVNSIPRLTLRRHTADRGQVVLG